MRFVQHMPVVVRRNGAFLKRRIVRIERVRQDLFDLLELCVVTNGRIRRFPFATELKIFNISVLFSPHGFGRMGSC